jgi:hypothetical protein
LSDLIALRAVFGQDEANHGTVRYRVDGDGLVRVPREAASFLISNGGFAVAKTTAIAIAETWADHAGKTLMRLHHDAAGGCSYAGREYPSNEQGDVLVPPGAAAELMAHGFVPVLEDDQRCAPGRQNEPAGVAKPPSPARPGRQRAMRG